MRIPFRWSSSCWQICAAQPLSALLSKGDSSIHPAFLINGIQHNSLFFGKFQAKAHGNRAYSLPGEDPTVYITMDTSEQYCKNKGDGHHCITAAEWAYLALLAKKTGRQPKGNNNYGKDTTESQYIAIPTPGVTDSGRTARVLTGTGPLTWSDNGQLDGVFDLNGNVWEWVAGFRLLDGEIQIIPYGNSMKSTCSMAAASTEWKAIKADGSLAEPGAAGTLKIDRESAASAAIVINTSVTTRTTDANDANCVFKDTKTAAGLTIPKILIAMGLFPDGGAAYGGDHFWARNNGERLPVRGSSFISRMGGGPSAVSLLDLRSLVSVGVGFRSAYVEL